MEKLSKLERMGGWIAAAGFAVCAAMVAESALAGIAATKHNLGSTGSTTGIYTSSTAEICVFCHTPHGGKTGSAPLWNKALVTTGYTLYGAAGGESATLDGTILPVGSVSQACLSCHDGTQAMDNLVNAPGSGGYNQTGVSQGWTWPNNAGGLMPAGVTNIGQDLRNDHPIGAPYCGGGIANDATGTCNDLDFKTTADGLKSQNINGALQFWVETGGNTTRQKTDMILYRRSDGTGPYVECGSCHDPHSDTNPTFLRIANTGSALCLACHVK